MTLKVAAFIGLEAARPPLGRRGGTRKIEHSRRSDVAVPSRLKHLTSKAAIV